MAVSAGFFSYYFVNQNQIDSQILQNTLHLSLEEKMALEYNVGEFGSDHAHAAIIVFVKDEQLNFGLPQFQLQSKYVHFENHNPYMVHKHATGVPLKMLFASIGIQISSNCLILNYQSDGNKFCADSKSGLIFVVNGQRVAVITEYEISHNDRILISFGDPNSVPAQIKYLESLQIYDMPKKSLPNSENDIFV